MARRLIFPTSKNKHKLNFFESPDEFFDSEIIKGAHIQLFFNRKIIVDGCQGVFEYSDDYIRLNLGKGTLILFGKDFDILSFEGKVITIKGCISSVEFCV